MTTSRNKILARVARATAKRPRDPHPGALDTPRAPDPVAEFIKRFRDNGGEVYVAKVGRSPSDWLTDFLPFIDSEVYGVAVGAEVPALLTPRLPRVVPAHAGAGVSVAWGAVSESGSLILPPTGPRAAQLLPPLHVIWVLPGRVFARMEDALATLRDDLPRAVGIHSGPSKSADIGRTVVTGVHGPGRCIALLLSTE